MQSRGWIEWHLHNAGPSNAQCAVNIYNINYASPWTEMSRVYAIYTIYIILYIFIFNGIVFGHQSSSLVIHKPLAHTNYFCILFILKIGRNLFISPSLDLSLLSLCLCLVYVNVYIYALCHFVNAFQPVFIFIWVFPQRSRKHKKKGNSRH